MRLMDKVAANPEVIDLIQEKLEKLATIKKRLVAEREELRSKLEGFTDAKEERNVIESSARDFQKGWPKASNAIKRRLVRRLLASLHYTREGLHAFYVTAQARLTVQPIPPKKMASEFSSEAISQNTLNLKKHPKHPAVNDMVSGVLRVVIGSGGTSLSTLQSHQAPPHDIIRFSAKTKDQIFEACAPLYEAGWSFCEIAAKTGYAKTSLRKVLVSRGLTLRPKTGASSSEFKAAPKVRSRIQPYGFAWLEGQLVKEPREYKTLLIIFDLWRSGKGLAYIARFLNDQKIPTRFGRKWHRATIKQIVERQPIETQ
jgi:hypothetical protein